MAKTNERIVGISVKVDETDFSGSSISVRKKFVIGRSY